MFEMVISVMFSVGFTAGFVLWGLVCNAWLDEMEQGAALGVSALAEDRDERGSDVRRAA
jgi:hypothetical protein